MAGLLLANNAFATTYHTITIDGTNDFVADETVSGTPTSTWYFTWDATTFFFGIDASDVASNSNTRWVHLYIDSDALAVPQSGPGTSTGINYNTQQPGLPFNADYHFRWKADNTFTNLQQWNGASWVNGAGVSHSRSGQFLEVAIPRSALGSPSSLYLVGSMINEAGGGEFTFFMAPNTNTAMYDANYSSYFGWTLGSGEIPNAPQHVNATLPVEISEFSID